MVLLVGCSETAVGPEEGTGDAARGDNAQSEVGMEISLPSGEQFVQRYVGFEERAPDLLASLADYAQQLIKDNGASGSIRVFIEGEAEIIIEGGAGEASSAVLRDVLPQLALDVAEILGFEGLDDVPTRKTGSETALREVTCTVHGYDPGACSPAEYGCAATWSCTDGSSGCVIVNPDLC